MAVEELRKARHKRFDKSFHMFVCPKLLKYEWIGQLYKVADIVLEIKPVQSYWPAECHENLILAVCFPFIQHRPWQLRNTPALLDVARILRGVWKNNSGTEGTILQQLLLFTRSLGTMSQSMVWRLLQGKFTCKVPCISARK